MNRNFEKEVIILNQMLTNQNLELAATKAMLDDALAELNQYKNNDNQEVAE